MELNAQTRSVNEVFSPNKVYIVPRFQREYSWQIEEVEEFWEDISQQISIDKTGAANYEEYFIGCIVLVGEDSKPEYLIVDGQQRLTTLTILLRAIIDRLNELEEASAAEALYKNVIEGTDNDGKKYFKLKNESPKPFFQNELQAISPAKINSAKTEEEKLLSAAFSTLKKRVKEYKVGALSPIESVRSLREQVLNYLKFILVTAKSEDDAYTIFETLNARGLSLTSVDLIKNWIFKNYDEVHPNDNAKDIWGGIRHSISTFSNLETFFRHYWNSKYAFSSDDRLYKSFKEFLKKGAISNAKDFLLELNGAADTYRKIGNPQDTDWPVKKEKTIKRSLDLLNQYRVTQPRPFLLALLECHKKKLVSQADSIDAITKLENFHFVFSNICQERASGLDGKYARAAKNIYSAGSNKQKVKVVIKDLLDYLANKRPTNQRIAEAVGELKFTSIDDNNKKVIQTIFVKIEAHLRATKELSVAEFSLEHIKDQSNGDNWIGYIGNLLPLDEKINNGIKSGASFSRKKEKYAKSELKIVELFIEKNTHNHWEEPEAEVWKSEIIKLLEIATRLK